MASGKTVMKQWWFWVIATAFLISAIISIREPAKTGGADSPGTSPAAELSASPAVSTETHEAAVVTKNIDGDTIEVELADGTTAKIRMIGVDTPESTIRHEPFGKEAAAYTKRTLPPGTAVYLEKDVSDTDKYGRLLRYVWLEIPSGGSEEEIREKMFNARLVLEGYANASTYPPDVKYADLFAAFAGEAQSRNAGLWALGLGEPAPTPTREPVTSYPYCASSGSGKFHHSWCSHAHRIQPGQLVTFSDRQQALDAGKEPCSVCNP